MAADGGFSTPNRSLAAQVCSTCKTRKKKCDKVLPRCDYCVRKGLSCGYDYEPPQQAAGRNHGILSPPVSFQSFSLTIPAEPLTSSEANLYLQVHGLIRETGQFVDDVSARYFQGIHRHLPIISRTRFHNNLITLGGTPSAGFSVLLVAVCLVSSCPELERRIRCTTDNDRQVDRRSMYLSARSLLAQVQAIFPPSVHLIQAGVLLAVYEYVNDRPDEAFASIAGCARMAYAARIHLCSRPSLQPPWTPTASANSDTDVSLQAQEAGNTWWGIVVCERTFFCDVAIAEQPLVTIMPGGDSRLPAEPIVPKQSGLLVIESVPYVKVSFLSSANVCGFARAAQAAWLLDQVLKGFETPNLDSRLFQLQGLDGALQSFLGVLMQQSDGKGVIFCEAIAITIRALFALHWHILSQPSQSVSDDPRSPNDWCKYSHPALDTATKMVLDVVEAHENSDPYLFLCVAPSYSYLVRAALKHIHSRTAWKDHSWLRIAEERLRTTLERFTL